MRYKSICIERLSLSAVCQGFVVEIGFHGMLQDVIQNIVIEEVVHYRLHGYDQYNDTETVLVFAYLPATRRVSGVLDTTTNNKQNGRFSDSLQTK